MSDAHCGPGPIILGPTNDGTSRILVRHLAQPGVQELLPGDIQLEPIRAQWITGTKLGLIASWADEHTAHGYAHQHGTLFGRIQPMTIRDLARRPADTVIAVLTDPRGEPLRGAQP